MIQEKNSSKTKQKNIYLLLGKEDYLKREFVRQLQKKLFCDDPAGLNFNVFDAREGARNIIDALETFPFISKHRLIIARDIEKFSPSDKSLISAYLKNPSSVNYLILETSLGTRDAFVDSLKREAETFTFERLSKGELARWIAKKIAEGGKRIDAGTLGFLRDLLPNNLEHISHELEKLITFVGKKTSIVKQDVEAIISPSMQETAFDFIECVSLKEPHKALELGLELYRDAKRIPEMIGLLGWQIKRLWRVKVLITKGKHSLDIARSCTVTDYIAQKLIEQADGFTLQELKRMLKALLSIDGLVKGGGIPSKDAVELLVAELFRDRC